MKQRSLLIFEESIKSSKSKKNYLYHIKYFLKFSKIKDYDGLIKVPTEQMQTILEDYVIYLKRKVNPNSVPIYITGIKHFFVMNRVRIYWEIIQKMYPEQVKRSGQKAWSDQHVQKMIEFSNSARNKALVHFMASTGARIGIHDYPLQMQHLRDMGDGCRAILIYAGETDEYWAFLTPESNQYLEDYFEQRKQNNEKFYPDTPIFRTEYRLGIEKTKQLKRNPAIGAITRLVKKAKIRRERVNKKNFDIQLDHGFRKRFNIILKLENDINSNIAEKIMGHSVSIPLDGAYLPAQDERVIQKCFTEFKKAIPQLTISDEERIRLENKKLKEEKSENELLRAKLDRFQEENEKSLQSIQDTLKKRDKEWEEAMLKLLDQSAKKFQDPEYTKKLADEANLEMENGNFD
jgi:integrase/recombinase XerD